jgi:hypothetical protein
VVVWVVTPYSLVERYQHFRGTFCLHLERRRVDTPVLLPWRQELVSSKRWYPSTTLHTITSQKTVILIFTSNLISKYVLESCSSTYNCHLSDSCNVTCVTNLQNCIFKMSQISSLCLNYYANALKMLTFARSVPFIHTYKYCFRLGQRVLKSSRVITYRTCILWGSMMSSHRISSRCQLRYNFRNAEQVWQRWTCELLLK